MVNRLQYLMGQIPEPTSYTDYYEIEALGDTYIVPLSTALAIERQLDGCATREWLEFRDVFGVEHRVLALCVYEIRECAAETREFLRAFVGSSAESSS